MKRIKRIAAVHDLSGYGKASLTVVIPILSTMGIQVCPLPTSILSSITEFPRTEMVDLTDSMQAAINHWRELNLKFEAVYSGFLGSPQQVDMVKTLIDGNTKDNALVIVDPVMGDNGRLYPVFSKKIIGCMRDLAAYAQIITPNITEASFLLGKALPEKPGKNQILDWLDELALLNPNVVIITSVPDDDETQTSVYALDKKAGEYYKISCPYLPGRFPGTGDTFTSIITGCLLQNKSLAQAMEISVSFVYNAIKYSLDYIQDRREGLFLEPLLPMLLTELKLFSISRLKR